MFLIVLVFFICGILLFIILNSFNRESFFVEKMYIKGNVLINGMLI